jgi:general secretion pathway protein K
MRRRTQPPRGVALLLTLWLIVVLGAVAAGVVAASRSATTVTVNLRARAAARYAAESGVVVAVSRVYELLSRARTPSERVLALSGLEEHFASLRESNLGTAHFSVAVLDPTARVDLNRAPSTTIHALIAQFTGDRKAESLVAALEDWKDADNLRRARGAEAAHYRRAGAQFIPANRPLQRLDELTRIAGFGDSLVARLAPYVTVDGDARINVNSAPEPVLAAIRSVGPGGARTLVAQRKMQGAFLTPAALGEALQGGPFGPGAALQLDLTPTRLLVVSRGWEPGRSLTHEIRAAYELREANLLLRSWRERDL